ncbi:multicopper oxidase [Sphaerobolus stellatus SS14]|uniref:Multicopper oxidase n=1 Tax=Sphaerobolus stellatus (strain SS14) TaxID=990650 RepID=A0A0C9W3S7_SPHS4|nr:multicopper oxidase [Sphaerobolus stellatus SS14]
MYWYTFYFIRLQALIIYPVIPYRYHSHLSTQYVDGIRGPLVIYDPQHPHKNLYDVDDESTIITLSDWYHTPGLDATEAWLAGGAEPVPDFGLINSAGRYSGCPEVQRARINVTKGKRYRFRIVSISAEGFFDFAIQGHSLTVLEAGGSNHVPYTMDSIQILLGKRYSVVVRINFSMLRYSPRSS